MTDTPSNNSTENPDLLGMELKKEMEALGRVMEDYRLIDGQILIKARIQMKLAADIGKARGDLFLILRDKDDKEKFFGDIGYGKFPVGEDTLETVFKCVFSVDQFMRFSEEIGQSLRLIDQAKKIS